MFLSENTFREDALEIIQIEGEGEYLYNRDLLITEDDGYVVILIEKLRGLVYTRNTPENLAGDRLRDRVELYILRPGPAIENFKLSIKSHANAAFRATVGFFKRGFQKAYDELPCKLCKVVCRLVVSALLANLGIPYFDPENAAAAIDISQHHEVIATVLTDPSQARHELLAEVLGRIDWSLLNAVRVALDGANWLLDATDRLYGRACAMVGCCQTE
ncbi:hypothetical protein [Ensifer adhaerens]|uniref:hypothetical protein n=1 Tax=Ensifer adhaerens TaxID=106592 RepID=UPI000CF05BF3|nr:hypothetical protein [Ensifer adhaerens]